VSGLPRAPDNESDERVDGSGSALSGLLDLGRTASSSVCILAKVALVSSSTSSPRFSSFLPALCAKASMRASSLAKAFFASMLARRI